MWTRTSRIIKAPAEVLYRAFMDPTVLIEWLPPAELTGKLHAFDARVGGGFRMSLYYPLREGEPGRGKTRDREDLVEVRFVELTPPTRIVEAVSFRSSDPAFLGEMTLVVTLDAVSEGTEVSFSFEDLPPGLRAEDDAAGARLSLEQLARRFE